jgi:hypothetical protein
MGRKAKPVAEVNKSAAIREVYAEKPDAKAKEVISILSYTSILTGDRGMHSVARNSSDR